MSGLKRESVIKFLDNPETGFAVAYAIINLLLIFLTLFAIAFELLASTFVKQHGWFFSSLETLILGFFSVDLVLRIICYKNRLKYLTSFYGVVDVLTVVPGLIAIFIPLGINTTSIRLLRIFRLTDTNDFAVSYWDDWERDRSRYRRAVRGVWSNCCLVHVPLTLYTLFPSTSCTFLFISGKATTTKVFPSINV